MFSFSAGHNILGFGSGIDDSDSSIESFVKEIVSSVPMEKLKRYINSGDKNDYPPINTPEINILYKDDNKEDVSLIKFLSETNEETSCSISYFK